MIWLALLACYTRPPVTGDPVSGGGGGEDDTGECGTCTLYNCEDETEPEVHTELDCEDAASDQGCEDWEWDDGGC